MLILKHFRARQASKCYGWSTFGEHKPSSATPEALSANQSLQALRLKHFRRPRASRNCACNTFGRTNASKCYSWSTFGDLKPPSATPEALSATQSLKSLRLQHFQPRRRIQMLLLKHFRRPQASRRCACSTFGDPKPPGATPEALSASQSPKKLLLQHLRRLRTSRVGPLENPKLEASKKRPPADVNPLQDGPKIAPAWGGPQCQASPRQNKHFWQHRPANRQGKDAPRQNKHFSENRTANRQGKNAAAPKRFP